MAIADTTSGIKVSSVYLFDPNATRDSLISTISENLSHCEAMTNVIYGEGFDAFNRMNDSLMENYLWALASKVTEIRAQFEVLTNHKGE